MAARFPVDLSRFLSDGSAINWPSGNRYIIGSERDEERFLERLSAAKNADRAPGTYNSYR